MKHLNAILLMMTTCGTILTGMAQSRIKFEGLTIKNETAFFRGKPFTGVSVAVYEDQTMREEVLWKDGMMDGVKTEYYQGAGVHARISFRENKRHGSFTYYYRNGQPKLKGTYVYNVLNDTLWSWYQNGQLQYLHVYDMGMRTGSIRTWFKNGAPEQVCALVGGKPHGPMYNYYADSSVRSIIHYQRGVREGSAYTWHNTGCLAEESYYKNGMLDSVQRVYDNLRCELIKSGFYQKGLKEGVFMQFDFLGDTLSLETWRNNKLHGSYITWLNGKRDTEGSYSNGIPNGYWIYGKESHYQWREGEYDEGVQIGTWWYYDSEGRKLMKQVYDDQGNLLEEKVFKKLK
jgi:antitoxin component YwqK of YwqJK toxin-antitoxin module